MVLRSGVDIQHVRLDDPTNLLRDLTVRILGQHRYETHCIALGTQITLRPIEYCIDIVPFCLSTAPLLLLHGRRRTIQYEYDADSALFVIYLCLRFTLLSWTS